MQIIAGKTVLTTLEEIVQPCRTALLVVDVQNEFCAADSIWNDGTHDAGVMRRVVGNIAGLIGHARAAGVKIVYIQMVTLPGLASWSPAYTRFMILKNGLPVDRAGPMPGSWAAAIVDEVAPKQGDLVVQKWRSSGFVGTELELLLRSAGVESLVVCGVATHACVESTIRDAFNKDFYVVEVEDCVAALDQRLHEASLSIMRTRIDVVSTQALARAWQSNGGVSSMEA